MSVVEYRVLLYQFSEEIDWQTQRRKLIFILRAYLPDGSEGGITDIDSLLTMLEEKNILGIDRLNVMKELLKEIEKWDLLRRIERFEIKRKDYKQLLEKIIHALDESNELQRLISICRGKNLIARESEEDIVDVNALFTVLEQQNDLGIEDLTLLKTLAKEVEKPDVCILLEEFEKKRKQEEDAERKKREREYNIRRARAQAASVLSGGINIGERLIGVVTPHCTFRNVTGGAVVVTTWMVLRRSLSIEEFVNAFKEAVLPFGNCLRAISEGSIRFTIQAENISALDVLWQSYQDEKLKTNLQEFLVTEEIKQLAGGEVTLTVHIDEDEYRNARFDLIISGTEEMKLEEKRGLKDRASSDSDLQKERNMTTANTKDPFPERKFLPFDRKVLVKEYLENLRETFSEITLPSDSGAGTWSSATSEYGFGKESILTSSSSARAVIQQLDNSIQLDKGFFKNPTTEDKRAIRGLARRAKHLKRFDVFYYLREITPPGTTGPWLHENLLIKDIPQYIKEKKSKLLERTFLGMQYQKSGPSDMNYPESTTILDLVAMRNELRTVGELYDLICERGLPHIADYL
nr:uncharacterized protein LOC131776110 [Pocillopora verrucosa]